MGQPQEYESSEMQYDKTNTTNTPSVTQIEIIKDRSKRISYSSRIQALCTILILVVTAYYAYHARRQADYAAKQVDCAIEQVEQAKEANENAIAIANNALKSSNDSFDKTLREMEAQSIAMQGMADATKKSTSIAARNVALSERTIDYSEKNFILEQRAWIVIYNLNLESKLDPSKVNNIHCTIENAGKTPAKNLKYKIISHLKLPDKPEIVTNLDSNEKEGSLGPGRKLVLHLYIDPKITDPSIIRGYISGTHALTISIEVTYNDIFSGTEIHRTNFCETYNYIDGGFLDCKNKENDVLN